jgi:flavodoxin
MKDKKCLIAFFSRAGENYEKGSIVNLKVGNTKIIASMIQEYLDGDLYEIRPRFSYPGGYAETTEIAKRELLESARPEIAGEACQADNYDVIFLGYPNWWGTMPMAVFTFLESHGLNGKTIIPFCTHEGSGMGRSVEDIKRTCPAADVMDGFAVSGSYAKSAKREVLEWLIKLENEELKH